VQEDCSSDSDGTEEEEVQVGFPVAMWDLLHCDPKVKGELLRDV